MHREAIRDQKRKDEKMKHKLSEELVTDASVADAIDELKRFAVQLWPKTSDDHLESSDDLNLESSVEHLEST